MMTITDEEFASLRALIHDRFGINLTERKRSLVVGRLQKLLQSEGFANFKTYHDSLLTDRSNKSLMALINRISTNYTYFYREKAHFDFFVQQALPTTIQRLTARRSNDLRIWTAGCASGEEPYMLAMLLDDSLGPEYEKWDAGVLATDISDRILNVARTAVYAKAQVSHVPPPLRLKYFADAGGGQFRVKERIKKDVTFRRFNLMHPFPFRKRFHVIFCRNVMIYFDAPTRDRLVKKFHDALESGGYLCIGHSETIGRAHDFFQYLRPATYMKR